MDPDHPPKGGEPTRTARGVGPGPTDENGPTSSPPPPAAQRRETARWTRTRTRDPNGPGVPDQRARWSERSEDKRAPGGRRAAASFKRSGTFAALAAGLALFGEAQLGPLG
jgi:hypothetical protein